MKMKNEVKIKLERVHTAQKTHYPPGNHHASHF